MNSVERLRMPEIPTDFEFNEVFCITKAALIITNMDNTVHSPSVEGSTSN